MSLPSIARDGSRKLLHRMQIERISLDLPHLWTRWLWKIRRGPCLQVLFSNLSFPSRVVTMHLKLHSHFLETQHCYAMQLGNTRVWDYVGDNFVHRLLQNNEDGKLVEVEGNSSGRRHPSSIFASCYVHNKH